MCLQKYYNLSYYVNENVCKRVFMQAYFLSLEIRVYILYSPIRNNDLLCKIVPSELSLNISLYICGFWTLQPEYKCLSQNTCRSQQHTMQENCDCYTSRRRKVCKNQKIKNKGDYSNVHKYSFKYFMQYLDQPVWYFIVRIFQSLQFTF